MKAKTRMVEILKVEVLNVVAMCNMEFVTYIQITFSSQPKVSEKFSLPNSKYALRWLMRMTDSQSLNEMVGKKVKQIYTDTWSFYGSATENKFVTFHVFYDLEGVQFPITEEEIYEIYEKNN